MKCPDCDNDLQAAVLKGVKVNECLKCKGKWFDRKDLLSAVGKADSSLAWLEFDPFGKDAQKLSVTSQGKQCPVCIKKMGSLTYLRSKIVIDKCPSCNGVWLSHGELARIIRYLEGVIDQKSAQDLTKDSFKEFIKIVADPKDAGQEVKDFLAVLYLLELRIAVEHPGLVRAAQDIYLDTPFK